MSDVDNKSDVLNKINEQVFDFKMPDGEPLDAFCRKNYCEWKKQALSELVKSCVAEKISFFLGANSFDYLIAGLNEDKTVLSVYVGYVFPANTEENYRDDTFVVIAEIEQRMREMLEAAVGGRYSIKTMSVLTQVGDCEQESNRLAEQHGVVAIYSSQIRHVDFKGAMKVGRVLDDSVFSSWSKLLHDLDHCGVDRPIYAHNLRMQRILADRYLSHMFQNFMEKVSFPSTYCYNGEGGIDKLVREDEPDLVEHYSKKLSAKHICYLLNIDYDQVCNDVKGALFCPEIRRPELLCKTMEQKYDMSSVKNDFMNHFTRVHIPVAQDDYEDIISKLDNPELTDFVQRLRTIEKSAVVNKLKISDLALNSAFVGDSQAVIDASMKAFMCYMTLLSDTKIRIETVCITDVNQTSDNNKDDGIGKVFKESDSNTIIIVRDLEHLVAEAFDQDYNKSKINYKLKTFFSVFDNGVDAVVFCTASLDGWQRLVTLYPDVRVIFQNVFKYERPTPDKLMSYFQQALKDEAYTVTEEAAAYCQQYFEHVQKNSMRGNLYYTVCDILFDEAKRNRLYRLATCDTDGDDTNGQQLVFSDVQQALADEYKPVKNESLEDIMSDLNQMIGLDIVKEKIRSLAALAKIQVLRMEKAIDNNEELSLHSIFYGNPGTGKTTVAHLIGRMYKSIGLLPSGHVVSVKRSDIVSFWVGGTAKLVKQVIKEAKGGVLFIDEAYDLAREGDTGRDSGHEAINTLVSEMEYMNKDTCVILAGYPNEMEHFLETNPGLSSRFVNKLHFKDYGAKELGLILMKMLAAHGYNICDKARYQIDNYLQDIGRREKCVFWQCPNVPNFGAGIEDYSRQKSPCRV